MEKTITCDTVISGGKISLFSTVKNGGIWRMDGGGKNWEKEAAGSIKTLLGIREKYTKKLSVFFGQNLRDFPVIL